MVIHSLMSWEKKVDYKQCVPNWYRMDLTKLQSRSACMIDSASRSHSGQMVSRGIPVFAKHSLTPMLCCMHFQINI